MRTEESFLQMMVRKNSGIDTREARFLFWSMARSVALFIISKRQSEKPRFEEEKLQRKLVKKIRFEKLEEAGGYFRRIQEKENDIRQQAKINKYAPHITERFVLESRISLFSEILQFTLEDVERIEQIEQELAGIRQQYIKPWKIGISAASTIALGFGLYRLFKSSPEKKDEKK